MVGFLLYLVNLYKINTLYQFHRLIVFKEICGFSGLLLRDLFWFFLVFWFWGSKKKSKRSV